MYSIISMSRDELQNHLESSVIAQGTIRIVGGQWLEVHYTQLGIYSARFIAPEEAQLIQQAPKLDTLIIAGTLFQLKVWRAALTITSGSLITYAQLARKIGAPDAARAVGAALGKNPIAYLIPCHRVVHSSGARGNYAWGEPRKKLLLDAEYIMTS